MPWIKVDCFMKVSAASPSQPKLRAPQPQLKSKGGGLLNRGSPNLKKMVAIMKENASYSLGTEPLLPLQP